MYLEQIWYPKVPLAQGYLPDGNPDCIRGSEECEALKVCENNMHGFCNISGNSIFPEALPEAPFATKKKI